MWQWLLILVILFCSPCFNRPCMGNPAETGPTSEEEATLLWHEGETAFLNSEYNQSAHFLQRYVTRYPGKPHYLTANLFLGKSLLEMGQPQQALPFLKNALALVNDPKEAVRCRVWIGQAHLSLHNFNEAYLISKEMDRLTEKSIHLPVDLLIEPLLVKTQALLGLHSPDRAAIALLSAEQLLSESTSVAIRAQLYNLQLKLKILNCNRLPSRGQLSEGQVRDQVDRLGTCLLESLLIYQRTLKAGSLSTAALTTVQVIDAFDEYSKVCTKKYLPKLTGQQKLTPLELRRYQEELTDRLKQDCKQKWIKAIDLLKSWKNTVPTEAMSSLLKATGSLEKRSAKNL